MVNNYQVSCVMCQVPGVRYQMSGVRHQVSGVKCNLSPVTCHMSLTSTATATDPPPDYSLTIHSRTLLLTLIHQQ